MNGKTLSIKEIAELVNGRAVGDTSLIIHGFAPIESAEESEISFLAGKKLERLNETNAGAVLVAKVGEPIDDKVLIEVRDPYLAAAIIHNYFLETPFVAEGIHPAAHVGENCSISKEISIGPKAVIGSGVKIGDRVQIEPGVVIGDDVVIGCDVILKANVTIYKECLIGDRVTIHAGTVIGSDGYGYAPNELGEHIKRPQVGIVRIEDDVEIGANSCVDRAAYGETVIKSGTKIDNLVQVGHNVVVGENSLIVAQVGISGSTTLGRNVVLGGQSAIAGHLHLGDRVMVAARGGVHNNQPPGAVLGGAPAINAKQWAKSCAIFNKLPELQAKVRKNSRAIAEMNKSEEE